MVGTEMGQAVWHIDYRYRFCLLLDEHSDDLLTLVGLESPGLIAGQKRTSFFEPQRFSVREQQSPQRDSLGVRKILQSMLALPPEGLAGMMPRCIGLEDLNFSEKPGGPSATDRLGQSPNDRIVMEAGLIDQVINIGIGEPTEMITLHELLDPLAVDWEIEESRVPQPAK